jgi:uncharacterized protein (DUF488 family)
MTLRILTVGHSNHDAEHFVALLRRHGVSAVADVRSAPFSRFSPQFNKDALKKTLQQDGISYVFLGKELGARSQDHSCYVDGQVQYSLLAKTELFCSGIERLLRGAEGEQIAVMCTEKDPLDCHRTLLVTRELVAAGAEVAHVLADGRVESNAEAMARLLEKQGLKQPDLFRSAEERLEEALHRQEQLIAYVDQDLLEPAAVKGSA